MKSSATIHLQIGNAVPAGNDRDTAEVIELWRQISGFFGQTPFVAQSGINGEARPYRVTLDAADLLTTLEKARTRSENFNHHRRSHIDDEQYAVDGALSITIDSEEELEQEESYQVAVVFLQQLVLAAHIVRPGSLQMLDARFTGAGAHRFEAQNFDSGILYGALKASIYNEGPRLESLPFADVWHWLDGCEVSRTPTAIRDVNKVLFTLLKVAEQRLEYSARTVLLVLYQLEVLLDCRQAGAQGLLGSRLRQVLGGIPEAADCLTELRDVRSRLFLASQPVHRPPLICHSTTSALKKQVGQHSNAVESGTALVMALLQDLVRHDAQSYQFTESFSRQ